MISIKPMHIRPKYFNLGKFIKVKQCTSCGVIGDEYYYMGSVCPHCGHNETKEFVAKWKEYTLTTKTKFIWYDPRTWFVQKFYSFGEWDKKETEDEI